MPAMPRQKRDLSLSKTFFVANFKYDYIWAHVQCQHITSCDARMAHRKGSQFKHGLVWQSHSTSW